MQYAKHVFGNETHFQEKLNEAMQAIGELTSSPIIITHQLVKLSQSVIPYNPNFMLSAILQFKTDFDLKDSQLRTLKMIS